MLFFFFFYSFEGNGPGLVLSGRLAVSFPSPRQGSLMPARIVSAIIKQKTKWSCWVTQPFVSPEENLRWDAVIHRWLRNGFISCCWLSHGLVGCPGLLAAFGGTGPTDIRSLHSVITIAGGAVSFTYLDLRKGQ